MHKPPRRSLKKASAVTVLAAATFIASATAATLDRVYGNHGFDHLGSGRVLDVAVAGDGSAVAVGYRGSSVLVARISRDGRHNTFLRAGRGVAQAVVLAGDGRIVVAGTAPAGRGNALMDAMFVERFRRDGSSDPSFGRGGRVVIRTNARGSALAFGPRGTIVVAGSVLGADGFSRVAIARLRSSGVPDASFGSRGFESIDLGPYSEANAVLPMRGGTVLFAGDQSPGLQQVNGFVGRLTSSGRLDFGFGHQGLYRYLHPRGGGYASFQTLAPGGRGRVLAGGADNEASGPHALLIRLDGRGSPDGSFGSGGVFTAPSGRQVLGGASPGIHGLASGRNRSVLAAGSYLNGVMSYGAVWTVTDRGRLDTHANPGGFQKLTLPGSLGGELETAAAGGRGGLILGGNLLSSDPSRSQGMLLRLSGI